MPRAIIQNAEGLSIELDRADPTFLPGDTVTGSVITRNDTLTGEYKHVRFNLFARAKTKAARSLGRGQVTHYRGRAQLLDIWFNLKDGTAVENGQMSWPFSLTIPTSPDPSVVKLGDDWSNESGFMANSEDVSKHSMPSVFYIIARSSTTTAEAYVEYVLQAVISKFPDKHTSSSPRAVMPLFVRSRSSEQPIEDFKLIRQPVMMTLKTLRLLPEHSNGQISFLQQLNSIFHRSSIPKYTFHLKVEYPSIIQLDHTEALPFKITIIPELGPDFTNICPNGDLSRVPPVKLKSISLHLKSTTKIRCISLLSKFDTEKIHYYSLGSFGPFSFGSMSIPTARPNGLQNRKESLNKRFDNGPSTLDLGELLDIHLSMTHSRNQGRTPTAFKKPLWPSFNTYNISVGYELVWKLEIECAGEIRTIDSESSSSVKAVTNNPTDRFDEGNTDEAIMINNNNTAVHLNQTTGKCLILQPSEWSMEPDNPTGMPGPEGTINSFDTLRALWARWDGGWRRSSSISSISSIRSEEAMGASIPQTVAVEGFNIATAIAGANVSGIHDARTESKANS